MELFNSISTMPSRAWEIYFEAMMNFKAAYPTLALFVFSALLVALVYLSVKRFKEPKSYREIFDIKARLKEPAPISNAITSLIAHIILFPLYVVFGLATLGIKIYFHFNMKKILKEIAIQEAESEK